jgi:hypothetical protein
MIIFKSTKYYNSYKLNYIKSNYIYKHEKLLKTHVHTFTQTQKLFKNAKFLKA